MRRARHVSSSPGVADGRIPLISLVQALAVAEHLNFRHAASALGVSQSSVSTRIKLLEEDLGILLFERRHRGVRLTEAGRAFVTEVSTGIGHLDHAIKTAGAVSDGAIGRIGIGLHASIAAGFFADLRRRFRDVYPDIEQIVVEGRSSETIKQVREGSLDVAFILGTVEAPDCHCRLLWNEPFMIAMPVEHPFAMTAAFEWLDLAPETFLVRQDGAGPQLRDHIVRRLSERGAMARIRRYDVGRDTLMRMVADGDGIALTSSATSHMPFPDLVFRPIADESEQARFSAVWSPHNRSPALKNLLDQADVMSRSTGPPENHTS